MSRWLVPLFVVSLLGLLALGLLRSGGEAGSALGGKEAPDFVLTDLQGKEHSLSGYRGTPVVLNFWASWCVPCHQESPLFGRVLADAGSSVQFLGVIYRDDPEKAAQFMERYRLQYPALKDPRLQTAIRYGVGKVPVTYVIDASGRVIFEHQGPVTDEAAFRRELEEVGVRF